MSSGMIIEKLEPQPMQENGVWWFGEEPFVSNEALQSHLFHSVYGAIGSPYGAIYGDGKADTFGGNRLADVSIEFLFPMGWVWVIEFEAVSDV
jgi:hypothetical protein